MAGNDIHIFSHENLLRQLESAEYRRGYYVLRFYSLNGFPSPHSTDSIDEYYLYPHAGTLRDKNFNLIFYDPRYDFYQGFKIPQRKNVDEL